MESVIIQDKHVVLLHLLAGEKLQPGDRLVNMSPHQFRKLFTFYTLKVGADPM